MAEEEKAAFPVIRQIFESTCFDPNRGAYDCVIIRVEWPPGYYHNIEIPRDEYDPNRVDEYVREWFIKYGRWVGKEIKPPE